MRTFHTGLLTGQFSNVCQSMWDPTGRQSGTWMDLFANTSVSLPANHYDTNALYSYELQLHLRQDTGSQCRQVFSVSKHHTNRTQVRSTHILELHTRRMRKKSSSNSRSFTSAEKVKVVSWIGGFVGSKFCPNMTVKNAVPVWDILMVLIIKMFTLWDVTPCILVDNTIVLSRHFRQNSRQFPVHSSTFCCWGSLASFQTWGTPGGGSWNVLITGPPGRGV